MNHEDPTDYFTRRAHERAQEYRKEYVTDWKRTTKWQKQRIVEGDFYCGLIDFINAKN